MRRLLLLFIVFVFSIGEKSFAQVPGIVGTNAFYAGKWLEIGEQSNGSFGAATVPAGYHSHCVLCDQPTPLAEVYDYGHDGWTVGAPAYMGDYTYPGSPFEGWEIQYGATGTSRGQAFCTGAATGTYVNVGGAGLTGSITGYTDIGGQQIGTWSGTASGGNLKIYQATEVDTFASWVVVTTKMYNTSAANIDSIYYMRSTDPDNNESWAGSAAFVTENWIDYQNDADHRVQVHATSSTPAPANQYPFALGTKDCRAVSLIYEEGYWPMASTQNLTAVWNKTFIPGSSWYTVSGGAPSVTEDNAMALIFKVGTICPNDSNFVSYAYTFNGAANGIDSALPEPTIVVNGFTVTPSVAPNPTTDTFNTCLYPGITVVPVSIINATTGSWTWSSWTWSSGTGLATTTGVTNTINVNSLPPYITYTITGTGYSPSCGSGGPCNSRTFYLTIHTCNGATVNSPCLGSPLYFNAPGDSTGATYKWVGPDSWTTVVSTSQSFTISPSVWSDTGTYHIIKTVSGTSDTSIAVVVIHPLPSVVASSNSPLCQSPLSVLSLNATPGVVPVASYSWTGPSGFTSALQNPTITSFTAANAGTYTVVVTTSFGCEDSATTLVVQVPPPSPPIVTDPPGYCYGTPFVPFTISGVTGTVYWYGNAAGTIGATTVTPTVNTSAPGTYTFYFGQTAGVCVSNIDSITIIVYPRIDPKFSFSIHYGCTEDTVYFNNLSTGFSSDTWSFGDGTANSTSTAPTISHIYTTQSNPLWTVTLTDNAAICSRDTTMKVDTRHTVTALFTAHFDTICVGQTSTMTDNLSTATVGNPNGSGGLLPGVIETYQYSWGDGTANTTLANNNNISHVFTTPGIHDVVLTVTDGIGCTNIHSEEVYVIGLTIKSWHDTTLCLKAPLYLENQITQTPPLGLTDFTYSWVSTPASGLSHLDSTNVDDPYFDNAFGTFTFTLTADLHGDWGTCVIKDTMSVNSVLGEKLHNVTSNLTVNYGSSIQLNADSLLYYWWIPDNGTLSNPNINNPIATPDTTTTYTVYGMDRYGCVDSQNVIVVVDSNMHETIPTAFTPNNDGLNDYFHPVGLTFQNLVDFRVYNRWGQQVFYTSSPSSKGWDGTFNGVPCDMDTYFYTIIVYRPDHGDNVIYKGDITLIR